MSKKSPQHHSLGFPTPHPISRCSTQMPLREPLPPACPLLDCSSLVGNPLGPQSMEGMGQIGPSLSVLTWPGSGTALMLSSYPCLADTLPRGAWTAQARQWFAYCNCVREDKGLKVWAVLNAITKCYSCWMSNVAECFADAAVNRMSLTGTQWGIK